MIDMCFLCGCKGGFEECYCFGRMRQLQIVGPL